MADPRNREHWRLAEVLLALGRQVRDAVVAACERTASEQLSEISSDDEGDTIYAVDRVGEHALVAGLEPVAAGLGGIVLVAEGLPAEGLVLPRGRRRDDAAWRVIVDPIDGTRGIMYQKRPAWFLAGAAPERGDATRLRDCVAAAQVEIPLVKQHLADELCGVRGAGVRAWRFDRLRGTRSDLRPRPSRAATPAHGYAMLTRFFPGGRAELAAIDDEVIGAVLGPRAARKALCFEDQYTSTGGQLYELAAGHDRFNADLRPLLGPLLAARGEPAVMCCHPYDCCTALIAEELGVIVTGIDGGPLDMPLDLDTDVAWVGYANAALRAAIEPPLQAALRRHGLLR